MTQPEVPQTLADWLKSKEAGGDGDEDIERELLRKMLANLGINLPITQAEVESVAMDLLRALQSVQEAGTLGEFAAGSSRLFETARRFQDYARSKFGADLAGSRTFAIFSELLRPARPSIEQKPTAEEFLSDFNTAFTAEIDRLREAEGLSGLEVQFAHDIIRPELFKQYTADLAKFAEAGASPFHLTEVSRKERGVQPGTTAGEALGGAVGPGVEEPTRIREELAGVGEAGAEAAQRRATELREQVEDIGVGVPREFIALPRLMPADFLRGVGLTGTGIRLKYAGSEQGAGARRRPQGGFVSAPRRV